jgi:Protein of unknown function (DUF2934)
MSFRDDNERIAKKAHELWEAEGRPHGRDQFHWDEAKEIIAIEDSETSTLLPAATGAEEPVEEKALTVDNEGDIPGLTDTGGDDLTSIAREPTITAQPAVAAAQPTVATVPPVVPAATPKTKAVAKKAATTGASKTGLVAASRKPATKTRAAKPTASPAE